MTTRNVAGVVKAAATADGAGVSLHRAFPGAGLDLIDPFLLFDHLGPTEYKPGTAAGFPEHPHRGFETVTYLLSGEMEHRDSFGNHGVLRPGDVQWMTAGSGLVHSEMPSEEFVKKGGVLHGFQLWVNLPKTEKMKSPHYQELPGAGIPVAGVGEAVEARVIAGEALGVKARIETHTPIEYLHFTLAPGAEHVQAIGSRHNAFVYVIEGEAAIGEASTHAVARDVVLLDRAGDGVKLRNVGDVKLSLLLIAGEPIGEPVARYGPFVMNSREEVYQAFDDYRSGKMGKIG